VSAVGLSIIMFFGKRAATATADALSSDDKSPGMDATHMRVAMLSEQLNSFGEPYIYFFAVTSLTIAGTVRFDRPHDLSSVAFPLPR
jgi:hypothetical protein